MKMFQTRCGNQWLYSDLDACELGGRDETTTMLVRQEWTLVTDSETLQKMPLRQSQCLLVELGLM